MWTLGKQSEFIAIEAMDVKKGIYHVKFSKVALSTIDENENDIRYVFRLIDRKLTVRRAKEILLNIIKDYDKSDEINCVYIGKDKTWFDKDTRTDLINSLKIKKEAGKTETTLWYTTNGELKSIVMGVDECLEFFYRLGLYADATFNITQTHIQAITAIDNVNDLVAYNITSNYPIPIKLNV